MRYQENNLKRQITTKKGSKDTENLSCIYFIEYNINITSRNISNYALIYKITEFEMRKKWQVRSQYAKLREVI